MKDTLQLLVGLVGLLALGVLIGVLLAQNVGAVSANALNQTVQLNATTECVTIVASDGNNATVCSFWDFPVQNLSLTYGGFAVTPVTDLTVLNTTINAPPFPVVNQNVSLTDGQAFYPDDSRLNFKVSCLAESFNNTVVVNNSVQVCEPLNVLQTLNPNEEYFNPELNIRVKAPSLVEVEKDLKAGDVFNRTNTCYGQINLTCLASTNATLDTPPSPTPIPPQNVECASGTHYEGGSCVSNAPITSIPSIYGFPLLDLIVAGAVVFVVLTKYANGNAKKTEDE